MTLKLHVKNLARCTELKFQFGVLNRKKKTIKIQLYEKFQSLK